MKILAEEPVVRYHVEFDEEETLILKSVGFLPPYASPRAQLWLTQAELDAALLRLGQDRPPGVKP